MRHLIRRFLRRFSVRVSTSEERISLDLLRSLASQRNWYELEARGREFLSTNPLQGDALALVGYSLQQQARLDEALTFALQACSLSPKDWLSHFIAGITLKGLGKAREACDYLRASVAIAPSNSLCLKELIGSIGLCDGVDSAASEYAEYCRRNGNKTDLSIANVLTVRDWAKTVGEPILEAGEVEEIPFESPRVWGEESEPERHVALSNEPYVAEIPDARIFSHSSLIMAADGSILSDTGGHARFGRYVNFVYDQVVLAQEPGKVLLDFSGYTTRKIEAGVFLSGLASNSFGHWLPEYLPKLQFLKQHAAFAGQPLIVDADMPQSHFEHLRRFADNPLILLQPNESVVCRHLLVAPSPVFSPVELFPSDVPTHEMPGLSPRALRFIRGDQLTNGDARRTRRIFLGRKQMKWRRLLNEDEISSDLSKIGFDTVLMEEMTVREQIEVFRQAQWIIAPNGSALLNLVFADTSVNLLILSQPNLFNWGTFQGPMRSLGYRPVWLRGEKAVAPNQKHSDYFIPVENVRRALVGLGLDDASVQPVR